MGNLRLFSVLALLGTVFSVAAAPDVWQRPQGGGASSYATLECLELGDAQANGCTLVTTAGTDADLATLALPASTTINSSSPEERHIAAMASKSAAYTIGTDDSDESYGGRVYVSSAATITLPAVASGMNVTVHTVGAIAVSLDTNASDRMYLDGVALDDGDKATNTSTTGDTINCAYESAAGWWCMSGSPDGDKWTDGGA